jgi:hypothetical protein
MVCRSSIETVVSFGAFVFGELVLAFVDVATYLIWSFLCSGVREQLDSRLDFGEQLMVKHFIEPFSVLF